MSRADGRSTGPRAVIHKRILDVAAANPDGSLEAIASEVAAATPDLVDRVLDEYGDPAASPEPTATTDEEGMTLNGNADERQENGQQPSVPEAGSLTPKQRETLSVVHERPDASQETVAATLGVTRATVSRRLNDVAGFAWADRDSFAAAYFDQAGAEPVRNRAGESPSETSPDGETDSSPASAGAGTVSGVDGANPPTAEPDRTDLIDRIEALERRLDGAGASLPPDLVHKVVHACMASDELTRDEELRVVDSLIG
jgi:septal ring-binding cell division protein DamX